MAQWNRLLVARRLLVMSCRMWMVVFSSPCCQNGEGKDFKVFFLFSVGRPGLKIHKEIPRLLKDKTRNEVIRKRTSICIGACHGRTQVGATTHGNLADNV